MDSKMPLRRGQPGRLRANASPTRASVPFLVATEPVPISNEIYLVGRFAAQRAFFYAGGRSLLVSHWEVEDQQRCCVDDRNIRCTGRQSPVIARRSIAAIHAGNDQSSAATQFGRTEILGAFRRRR